MAHSLVSSVDLKVVGTVTDVQDLATAEASLVQTYSTAMSSGTTAAKADLMFSDSRTLTASSHEDLDLGGVLVDPLGAVLTFAKVKAIIIRASAGNTHNVVVGGDATSTFFSWVGAEGDSVVVRPGGTFALFTGDGDGTAYAVTATTGDLLRITNGGASTPVTYDVIIIGTSA